MTRSARPTGKMLLILISMLVPVPGWAQVTFSAPVSYTVGTAPGNIIIADFNGDGTPDLAVANNGDASMADLGSVSILLGTGDGNFQSALDVPAGAFPAIILSGDFNGDSKQDLFVEGQPSNNTTLVPWSVLLGHGDGTFGAPSKIALTDFTPGLVAGDFNNDKKLDLVFFDSASGSLEEEMGNGDGTFQPSQVIGSFASTQVLIADFNGDGNSDLALGVRTVQILLGNADGTFRPPIPLDLNGAGGQELLVADVNNDGKADLIATSEKTERFPPSCFICSVTATFHLEVHVSNGDGSFQPGSDIATEITNSGYLQPKAGTAMGPFSLGDFDSDGRLDIAYERLTFAGAPLSLVVLGGRGDGTFPTALGTISGSLAGAPLTADLNADKLADLGAQPLTSSSIGVVLNTTRGFWLGAPAAVGPVRAGGSATGTVSVNPQNGFSHAISLTCSAPQSEGIQCSLSSSTVTPGASATLTVTTTGNSASRSLAAVSHPGWLYALSLPFAGIVFGRLGFGSNQTTKRKIALLALWTVVLVGVLFQTACGGGIKPGGEGGTTPGKYRITVTGTSGVTQRSTTVAVTVQ